MNLWVLIGTIGILGANYLQIAQEWKTRGLTDTGYFVVLVLIASPLSMAYGFEHDQMRTPALVSLGVAVCAGVMLSLKLKDLWHTRLKTLG